MTLINVFVQMRISSLAIGDRKILRRGKVEISFVVAIIWLSSFDFIVISVINSIVDFDIPFLLEKKKSDLLLTVLFRFTPLFLVPSAFAYAGVVKLFEINSHDVADW